jgi:hypothetical protein
MNRKRYSELEGVTVETEKIPATIRHLIGDFRLWSFITDDAVVEKTEKASTRDLQALLDRCEPHLDAIENYAFAHKDDTPMPHEAAVVQIFLNNYYNAKSELKLRLSKKARG